MHERWIEVDDYVLAATMDRDDGKRFRLSVEWLPTGGWDWVVWSSKAESCYGVTESCDAAIIAAETAVALVGRGEVPGHSESLVARRASCGNTGQPRSRLKAASPSAALYKTNRSV
jgi:hypothetical protein